MNYVIIGNSAAAIACVEAIRKTDKTGSIVLISDEEYTSYSRPVISYLLAGTAAKKKMWYRGPDFYKKNHVKPLLGKTVSNINTRKKYVLLTNGEEIFYDKLLIATGGKPFIPQIKGTGGEKFFTFTKWSDVDRIMKVIKEIHQAVVIGAGMIGTKATEALVYRGISVTLVELADSVLCKALDKEAAEIVQKRMEQKGVSIFLNNEVKGIVYKDSKINHIILRDKTEVMCDAVIAAIGVVPNIDVVKDTDIKINRGIVVNSNMETNIKGIYAAGDVAEADDSIMGGKRPVPIWPLASRQGSIAGMNMASKKKDCPAGFSMNSIEFCGISTVSMGITDVSGDEYESIKKSDIKKGTYMKIVLKDNRIVGAAMVGSIDKAGIINTLIKEKIDVSDIKDDLLSDDFGYISFSRIFRRERLEKVV